MRALLIAIGLILASCDFAPPRSAEATLRQSSARELLTTKLYASDAAGGAEV